jgi:hypothetical protein
MAGEVLGVAWGNFDSVKLSTKYFGDHKLDVSIEYDFLFENISRAIEVRF